MAVAGGETLGISVLAAVTSSQPNIQLSQNGLRFQAVSGGNRDVAADHHSPQSRRRHAQLFSRGVHDCGWQLVERYSNFWFEQRSVGGLGYSQCESLGIIAGRLLRDHSVCVVSRLKFSASNIGGVERPLAGQ